MVGDLHGRSRSPSQSTRRRKRLSDASGRAICEWCGKTDCDTMRRRSTDAGHAIESMIAQLQPDSRPDTPDDVVEREHGEDILHQIASVYGTPLGGPSPLQMPLRTQSQRQPRSASESSDQRTSRAWHFINSAGISRTYSTKRSQRSSSQP